MCIGRQCLTIRSLGEMSRLYTDNELVQCLHSPASRVVTLRDGSLGSPVPNVLVAMTRNSYSEYGIKPSTVAVSALPSTIGGAGKRQNAWGSRCVCILGVIQKGARQECAHTLCPPDRPHTLCQIGDLRALKGCLPPNLQCLPFCSC